MTNSLFVYGTLKRRTPGKPHRLLRGAQFVGSASVRGKLYDLGRYPGLVRNGTTDDRVYGELYELPQTVAVRSLRTLDEYEGDEFDRRRMYATLSNGRRRASWVYVLRERPPESARPVRSGRYKTKRGAA